MWCRQEQEVEKNERLRVSERKRGHENVKSVYLVFGEFSQLCASGTRSATVLYWVDLLRAVGFLVSSSTSRPNQNRCPI